MRKSVLIFFLLFFSSLSGSSFSFYHISPFLSISFVFGKIKSQMMNIWATCFKLLIPKHVNLLFSVWGAHNVINSLVLCGCTEWFCELKEHALKVLSCPRTVCADI